MQIPINENSLFNKNTFTQDQHETLQKGFYKATTGGTDGPIQLIMLTADGGKLYVNGMLSGAEFYKEYIEKTAIALALIFLTSVAGAAMFARRIANPIRKIADDTQKMAKLENVPAPIARKDEIGQLAGDVYKMYEELKSTISQLESEIAREKEMEENQRYFFSAASHELKTPIAAMSALLEELLEGMVDDKDYPEAFRKCMKMISGQKKIISEILEIVRLSDHRLDIHNQEVYLHDAVDSILPMYQPLAEANNIELVIDVSKQLRCHIDPKMLERVLSNVFMNAIQNTPEYGMIRIWCEEKSTEEVQFYILNIGEHINEEIMSKLFEPFFRVDKARSRQSGHSGLGLTIVKRTLDHLGIPFSLENADEAVLFWMRLPT